MSGSFGLRWIVAFLCIASCGLLPSLWGEESAQLEPWSPEKVLASAKLSEYRQMLFLPVQIDGKERRVLINTDLPITQIERKLVAHLPKFDLAKVGVSKELADAADDLICVAPRLEIGTHLAKIMMVMRVDSGDSIKELPFEVHGALGMDVLKELVLHIDPEHDVISLSQPSTTIRPPGKSSPFVYGKNSVPFVQIVFASGIREPFKIDTSLYTASGEFTRNVINQLGLLDGVSLLRQQPTTNDDGEPDSDDYYRVAAVTMAGATAKNMVFLSGAENRLSANFLLRQRVTIDFKAERIYCEPTRFAEARDRYVGDGFWAVPDGQRIVIDAVEPESIAAQAGLRIGDQILSVGGIPVKGEGALAIRQFYVPSDQPIKVQVSRDGKNETVELPGK